MIVVVTGLRNQIDGGVGNGVFSSTWMERDTALRNVFILHGRFIVPSAIDGIIRR